MLNRQTYCKIKRKTKAKYFSKEKARLSDMSKTSPRKFWQYINKFKNGSSGKGQGPSLDDFVEHFKNVSNTPHGEFSLDPDNLRNTSVSIDELDRPFSVEEISKTISSLQRHKSADYNNYVSGFFY